MPTLHFLLAAVTAAHSPVKKPEVANKKTRGTWRTGTRLSGT